ncbi:MAG: response regulator [Chloroflexi bacterium]|nr:response regulator [Chloroflexota bacterium]
MTGARILVVEDESIVSMDMQAQLRALGYDLVGATSDSNEAIKQARESRPDLVLMDIHLADGMDGIEAAGEIWSRLNIPVVYVTAYSDEETLHRAKVTEPFGYILKPFDRRELHTAIEMALYKHRADVALHRSADLYRSLVEASGAWIFRVDRQGHMKSFIAPESPPYQQVSGTMQTSQLEDTVVPEDRARLQALLHQVFETGAPVRGITFGTTAGGELRYLSANWEPIRDAEGNVVEVQSTTFDITERRRLEEQYHQAQRIESVGRLAGGVAHDFNNLLTVILGYSEMGLTSLPPDSPVRRYLEQIKGAGERAAALTRQLLAFSRRQTIQPRVTDLGELVSGLVKMLHRLIREDIELSIVVPPGAWPARVDPGQIEQVLVNLAVNARDAMPHGGKLAIEVANTSLDQDFVRRYPEVAPGDYIMLSVTDTGTGMSEEVQAHLFEPFFTTQAQASGLGLASSYGIAKQARGHIFVDSELGTGTTIRFYVPRTTNRPEETPEEGTPPEPPGTETILVAEDEPAVRTLATSVLRQLGYSVLEAGNGADALRLLEDLEGETVHVLLTDVVMPHMGGKELAQKVASSRPNTRVLFMSGYAPIDRGAVEPGITFLQKPFTRRELACKVRELLDR